MSDNSDRLAVSGKTSEFEVETGNLCLGIVWLQSDTSNRHVHPANRV